MKGLGNTVLKRRHGILGVVSLLWLTWVASGCSRAPTGHTGAAGDPSERDRAGCAPISGRDWEKRGIRNR
jgi:hypothetical protein